MSKRSIPRVYLTQSGPFDKIRVDSPKDWADFQPSVEVTNRGSFFLVDVRR